MVCHGPRRNDLASNEQCMLPIVRPRTVALVLHRVGKHLARIEFHVRGYTGFTVDRGQTVLEVDGQFLP